MHERTTYLYDFDGQVSPALKWKRVFMTDAQQTLNHMMLEDIGIVVDCALLHLEDKSDKVWLCRYCQVGDANPKS